MEGRAGEDHGNHSQLVAGCYTNQLGHAKSSPSISPLINCLKPNHKEGLIYCLNTCRVGILTRAAFQLVLATLIKVANCLQYTAMKSATTILINVLVRY